jgi:hypothetical protein
LFRSRGSAVGRVTGYELDDRGVGVRVPVRSRPALSLAQLGTVSPKVKRPGRESDRSPPTCADVKETSICTVISEKNLPARTCDLRVSVL